MANANYKNQVTKGKELIKKYRQRDLNYSKLMYFLDVKGDYDQICESFYYGFLQGYLAATGEQKKKEKQ